jgi:hypothetical protein
VPEIVVSLVTETAEALKKIKMDRNRKNSFKEYFLTLYE